MDLFFIPSLGVFLMIKKIDSLPEKLEISHLIPTPIPF